MHGYSDDGSEDEGNNGNAVPASGKAAESPNTTKKKPRMPPQRRINRHWKRFSERHFSTVVSVLPFSPVQPTAAAVHNELLEVGYTRAVGECRRKVEKIIAECRRINMRYRDADWDIDWDLKYKNGFCLNSLGETMWELSSDSTLNTDAHVPKAVMRVHEIFENPTFMEITGCSEAKRGRLGDGWLMAGLSGLSNVRDGLQRSCVRYDTRIGVYGFVFYRDGEWIFSIIDDKLYLTSACWDTPSMHRHLLQQIERKDEERVYRETYQTGSKALFFAQCKDQNETWVPLLEKAYAKAHGDYASLDGGWVGEGLEDLSGGVTSEILSSDILDVEDFWNNELSRVNEEFLFGCMTGLLDGGYGHREGIAEGHSYTVLEARTLKSGTRLLKLRKPWGTNREGNWNGPWSDGTKEWTKAVQEELGHAFGNDSVFWISYEDLLRKFQHFDRTRLFREADWRCCQRWIGIEVPWKPHYDEKFRIKITQETPIVLVLSQLDDRYFSGLLGQYSYRLQFRVHELGHPDAEDYIVRSHGNYLMHRSVSIELPSMLPGQYSVFISIAAKRDTGLPSIDDVVKSELKKRVENVKLTQVGQAFDLAHSKGAAHLERVAKARKKHEGKEASEVRKIERRKLWEARHKIRGTGRKQKKKNQEKMMTICANARQEWKLKRRQTTEKNKIRRKEKKAKKNEEAAERNDAQKVQTQFIAKKDEQDGRKGQETAAKDDHTRQGDVKDAKENAVADQDQPPGAAQDDRTIEPDERVVKHSEDEPEDVHLLSVPPANPSAVSATPPLASLPLQQKGAPDATQEATQAAAPVCRCACTSVLAATGPAAQTPAPAPAAEAGRRASSSDSSSSDSSDSPVPAYKRPDDSSDSPISEFEDLYLTDDTTRNLYPNTRRVPRSSKYRDESDDENGPDPWNAICIVGFRVYSKDERLQLGAVLEGGELEEGGIGGKGEADLDDAQGNAGGQRSTAPQETEDKTEPNMDDYDGDTEGDQRAEKGAQRKEGNNDKKT